jgi:phage-related protein
MAQGLTTNTIQTNGSTVSPGTAITGFSAAVMFDKGAAEAPKLRVIKTQFGDGYEQRMVDGINNAPRSWSLVFNNRTREDVDKLYTFFTTLAGVNTCRLTIPNTVSGDENVIVVIEEFSRTMGNTLYYSLVCKAREVFEL